MDGFLIAVTIILSLLLIFVNFYLLALYCHRKFFFKINQKSKIVSKTYYGNNNNLIFLK